MAKSKLVVGYAILICCYNISACSSQDTRSAKESSSLLPVDTVERLAERSAPKFAAGASAPSFIIDPTWPKPLPHNWRIGQVGGIAVDKHDNIWVYHRPRSLSASAAGGLGVAGTNVDGIAVDGLGNSRVFAELTSGCCVPAPSVLKFDQQGNLLDSWGGPSDPDFLEEKCLSLIHI